MNELVAFLPPVLAQLAVGILMLMFWWPIRKEYYGKSLPLLVGIGVLSYLMGSLVNPTLIFSFKKLVLSGIAATDVHWMNLLWSICENLFFVLIVILVLADITNLIPDEIRKNHPLFRSFETLYKSIVFIGIVLFLLRIIPALVMYVYINRKPLPPPF